MKERDSVGESENFIKTSKISRLDEKVGEKVGLEGWVFTVREQKRMKFIVMRDDTGLVQLTVDGETNKDLANKISKITPESAIRAIGSVVENPRVNLRGIEVVADDIKIEAAADSNLPINMKGVPSNLDSRLDWRFLDIRRPENRFIFEFQTDAEREMRKFWEKEKFIEIHSPKMMGTPSESGAELFEVKNYFGKKAFLAQSPQFYKQYAIASGLNKVFEVGPVFRANPSFTSRHDTEFTSVDVEVAWVNSHKDVMALEEKWLQFVIARLAKKHNENIREKFNTELVVPKLPFPKITMEEAQRILKNLGHNAPSDTKKGDLDPQGERILGEYVKNKYDHEFVFITDWPKDLRPFYHMRSEKDPQITKSFDLLWKGLEVTTGAQREHRYDVLVDQAKEKGINPESMAFYLDVFKYGPPPHGGYGFGLTRMLMQALEIKNVREVTFLYRGPNRLEP